jgi:hypothetical protein
MGRHDFEVDLQAVVTAAKGIADAAKLFKDKDVSDLIPGKGDVGDDSLWSALDEFQDRWERGTKNMVEDVQEAGGRLGKMAMNYLEYEQEAAKPLAELTGEFGALALPGVEGP